MLVRELESGERLFGMTVELKKKGNNGFAFGAHILTAESEDKIYVGWNTIKNRGSRQLDYGDTFLVTIIPNKGYEGTGILWKSDTAIFSTPDQEWFDLWRKLHGKKVQ